MKQKCELVFDTDKSQFLIINTETKEETVLNINAKRKEVSKTKDVATTSATPQVTLGENTLSFNEAALQLLGIQSGDRVGIGYDSVSTGLQPFIKIGDGNKLTKSNNIAFRGKSNNELSKLGNSFTVSKQGDKFILVLENVDKVEVPGIAPSPDQAIIDELNSLNGEEFKDATELSVDDLMSLLN